jgi:hypothetical protein
MPPNLKKRAGTEWPPNLPRWLARDAYAPLAAKLLEDNKRLWTLFQDRQSSLPASKRHGSNSTKAASHGKVHGRSVMGPGGQGTYSGATSSFVMQSSSSTTTTIQRSSHVVVEDSRILQSGSQMSAGELLACRAHSRHERFLSPEEKLGQDILWKSSEITVFRMHNVAAPQEPIQIAHALLSREGVDGGPPISTWDANQLFQALDQKVEAMGDVDTTSMVGAVAPTGLLSPRMNFLTLCSLVLTSESEHDVLFLLSGLVFSAGKPDGALTAHGKALVDILVRLALKRDEIYIPFGVRTEKIVPDNREVVLAELVGRARELFGAHKTAFTLKRPQLQYYFLGYAAPTTNQELEQFEAAEAAYNAEVASSLESFCELFIPYANAVLDLLESFDPTICKETPTLPSFTLSVSLPRVNLAALVESVEIETKAAFIGGVVRKVLASLLRAAQSCDVTPSSFRSCLAIGIPIAKLEIQSRVELTIHGSIGMPEAFPASGSLRMVLEQAESLKDRPNGVNEEHLLSHSFAQIRHAVRPPWQGKKETIKKGDDGDVAGIAAQLADLKRIFGEKKDVLSSALSASMEQSTAAYMKHEELIAPKVEISTVVEYKSTLQQLAEGLVVHLKHRIQWHESPITSQMLQAAGLAPLLSPLLMVHLLLPSNQIGASCQWSQICPLDAKLLLVVLVDVWVHVQYAERIISLDMDGNEYLRDRELLNELHENCDVTRRVAWLLLELEANIGIRAVQMKVAEAIIKPSGKSHEILQLNMGEGKSSVILPITAYSLWQKGTAVRIIVPDALVRATVETISLRLGGLLGRRVFQLPFRRDIGFSSSTLSGVESILSQTMSEGGVIVCSPEHVLSFQLKSIEMMNVQEGHGVRLARMLKIYHRHTRDILDESDEVLHVRHQLVYTIGSQQDIDAGSRRWTVIQGVLAMAYRSASMWSEVYTDEVIELTQLQSFSNLHIPRFKDHEKLDEAYDELAESILDDIFARKLAEERVPLVLKSLNDKERVIVKTFVLAKDISSQSDPIVLDFDKTMAKVKDKDVYLILRGLLAYNVLRLAFSKRWRVDFGVDPSSSRGMAVPFRAKDKASKNTEFGHADVALCLTYISYHRSGLDKVMFDNVVELLLREEDAAAVFSDWMEYLIAHGVRRLR